MAKAAKSSKSATPAGKSSAKAKVTQSAVARPAAKSAKKPAGKAIGKKATLKKPAIKAASKPAAKAAKPKKTAPTPPKVTTKSKHKVPATKVTATKVTATKVPVTKVAATKVPATKAAVNGRHKALGSGVDAAKPGSSFAASFKPGSHGGAEGGSGALLHGKPGSSGAIDAADSDKPRLSKTKLGVRELEHFRDLLFAKRRQLHNDAEQMETEALRSEGSNLSTLPVHMADIGTDNYEQEFTLSLVDRDRKLIDDINHALSKIEQKTYGICEGSGQMIPKPRLESIPWTRYSIEYAQQIQRRGVRRNSALEPATMSIHSSDD